MFALWMQGFVLQASLIIVLGAQNIFVLDAGIKNRHPLLVASICSLCDIFLVFLGTLGAASLFLLFPIVKFSFGLAGVLFLLFYGVKKIREGFSSKQIELSSEFSKKSIFWTSIGFSLLNPHVYLDTVVLIGGYSAKFPQILERFVFGLGAGSASVFWFFALAFLGIKISGFVQNPKVMTKVSVISGLLLIGMALVLGLELRVWFAAL